MSVALLLLEKYQDLQQTLTFAILTPNLYGLDP